MTNKTSAFAFTLASLAGLAAVVPSQAATRSVNIHAELFASRCVAQGGTIASANPALACQTPETTIVCSFLTLNQARCEWPGIEGQIAVNRIIGMQDAQLLDGSSGGATQQGGGGGGGGLVDNLPDLPFDNGNGGGGIDLPDLPINNG